MTREPDRFDHRVISLFHTRCPHTDDRRASECDSCLAAALRQAADEALEKAAQLCRRVAREEAPRSQVGKHAALRCEELIKYALASPAVAPAAEPVCQFVTETGANRCTLPAGHTSWRKVEPNHSPRPAPPSEPVAPAAEGLPTRCTCGHAVHVPPCPVAEPVAPADLRDLLQETRGYLAALGWEHANGLVKRIDVALADGGEGKT